MSLSTSNPHAHGSRPLSAKKSAKGLKVEIPEPHPQADPDAALNAIAEYKQALRQWQQLPFWQKLVTPRPQHPSGV